MDGLRIVAERDLPLSKRLARIIRYLYFYNAEAKEIVSKDADIPDLLLDFEEDLKVEPGHSLLETRDAEYIWTML
jgi:hypothetical protein